jgi:hypothetical protein
VTALRTLAETTAQRRRNPALLVVACRNGVYPPGRCKGQT